MKLVIFGSRSLQGGESYKFIEKEVRKFKKIEYLILPGGIKGVCDLSLKIAEKLVIPVKLYFYGEHTGKWFVVDSIRRRTKQMVEEGDYFLIFHDGISKGTLWDLEKVKKAEKRYKYFIIKEKDIEDYFDKELTEIVEDAERGLKKING